MSKKTNGKVLQELLIQITTLKERINNSIQKSDERAKKNDEDHSEIKRQLEKIHQIAGNEIKDVEKRLRALEDRELKLSTTWKIGIFLMGAIPTIIEILRVLKII